MPNIRMPFLVMKMPDFKQVPYIGTGTLLLIIIHKAITTILT